VVAVQIMAISVALRWMGGLYRGVVTGAEKLVWLSGFNALIATLRFIAVFATMWLYGFTPFVFFIHQLVVALLEVVGLFAMSTCLIPSRHNLEGAIGWSFHPVKPVLKFALTIAFTSSVWILVTQTDKLVLSGILPLAEYGYFTLAVLVASGIMVITMPISSAIMPRMARLHAEGKHAELIQIYRNATQLVSVIAGSAAITIAFYAEPLLYAWTGDRELAAQSTPILRLYAIGNGFLSLAAFAYYLQYALGNLRYHLIGNAVMVVTLLPTVIIAATYWGGVGAGYVWVAVNGLFLFAWVGYVHHKLQPKLHQVWIWNDIVCIILPVAFVLGGVFYINVEFSSRLMAALYIIAISVMAIVTGVFSSRYMRVFLLKRLFVN
jgi:O-antigen/teichoic acid export membrane protein